MGVHGTLRRPGGAGGVEQRGQVVLGHPVAERHLVSGGDQVLVVIRHRQHLADSGGTQVVGVGEDHAYPGVIEDGAHFRGRQPRVDRDQHVTSGREPEVELEVSVRVERDDPDAVLRRQAKLAHRAGQAAASRAELGIGTAIVLTHNGGGFSGGAESPAERLGECIHRLASKETESLSFSPFRLAEIPERSTLATLPAVLRGEMGEGPAA